jgi:hypothetical protein
MIRTVEAVIDQWGEVRLLEPLKLPHARRALVVVLDDVPAEPLHETALLSEVALAEEWSRPEEDQAWSYLQSVEEKLASREQVLKPDIAKLRPGSPRGIHA